MTNEKGLRSQIVLIVVAIGFSVLSVHPQTKTIVLPARPPITPPGNIRLLVNYVHETRQTIDTSEGSFVRSDGFKIDYWNGSHVTNLARKRLREDKDKVIWSKQIAHFDDVVFLAYFKDGEIIASFDKSKANFYSLTKTSEDVADFVLIVMTYNPPKRQNPISTKKK
jgi:hypothetical protein